MPLVTSGTLLLLVSNGRFFGLPDKLRLLNREMTPPAKIDRSSSDESSTRSPFFSRGDVTGLVLLASVEYVVAVLCTNATGKEGVPEFGLLGGNL